ncbi:MAG: acyl-CoA desaturase [Alphaproteobacteria bacterium]|nr:acyl-CoA desaturase [Alphaproteobacteria bacterium]
MSRLIPAEVPRKAPGDRYCLVEAIPFALAHLACMAVVFTGVDLTALLIAVAFYAVRMFGITAGYHRYFSHRTFKTSRVFAFVLGFIAQSSAQRGVLWWASAHRHHHRFSDTDNDVHSPVRRGFWYAHFGWFFTVKHRVTNFDTIPDLSKFPELRWLDRQHYLPAIVVAILAFLIGGWSGLVVGFFWSTVALWHATFSINSLAHVVGRRRYPTGDQSRNNWWLALLTFGEGWHNNHHHYQSAARQGFRWYEVDFSYYALKALSAVGLVWDLQTAPKRVVRNEQRLRRAVVEKVAAELAGTFPVEKIAADLRAALGEKRASLDASLHELQDELAALIEKGQHQFDQKAETFRDELEQLIHAIDLSALPSVGDIRDRAAATFMRTPSLNEIAERARHILIDDLCEALIAAKAVPANAGR